VDVRIITATNKIIPELISKGQFREDLFFRINVIPVHLPPLRERTEDIPLLADHFIHRLRAKSDKDIKGLSPETLKIFMGQRSGAQEQPGVRLRPGRCGTH
jgi:transcriptional regulator with PAS, ATPase and Fis domain